LLDFGSAEPSISLPAQTASSAELPGYFPVEDPVIAHAPIDPLPVTHPTTSEPASLRSAGWRWRAALTFAGIVTMALVLAFGLRRSGSASAQSAAVVPDEKLLAASTGSNLPNPSDTAASSSQNLPAARPVLKESRPPIAASKTAPSSKSVASKQVPRRHEDDLVAPDTVTYLDKGLAPHVVAKASSKAKPAKQIARTHSRRHTHRDEVVAANKVTYLNKPAPKVTK
jgi:hypothetical protein